jgi:hypothetical protein
LILAPVSGNPVSKDDIRRILGDLDDGKLLDIMAVRSTVLEDASIWLSGVTGAFGADRSLRPIAGDIAIVIAGQKNDRRVPAEQDDLTLDSARAQDADLEGRTRGSDHQCAPR